jgi:hypothetical protein
VLAISPILLVVLAIGCAHGDRALPLACAHTEL